MALDQDQKLEVLKLAVELAKAIIAKSSSVDLKPGNMETLVRPMYAELKLLVER